MPGIHPRFEQPQGSNASISDEAAELDIQLQKQLEDDIARIFDESLHADLEISCGKLKVLTHSCILETRSQQFYRKIESILHVRISRNTFDEIYSFISDVYTECDIKHQEKEIIKYLEELNKLNTKNQKREEEQDVFLTPKCTTPQANKSLHETISSSTSSPSTELTKEYYALVPIEENLDKELIEQEVLSNGLRSFIKAQQDENQSQSLRSKPTSLSLTSSQNSKPAKHSKKCDTNSYKINPNENVHLNFNYSMKKTSQNNINGNHSNNNTDSLLDKEGEISYSPDSLIADDPSVSLDYLSPEAVSSFSQIIPSLNNTKMDNAITLSDSGLENTGMLESLDSHKDVTVADLTLSDRRLLDLNTDEVTTSVDSIPSLNGQTASQNNIQKENNMKSSKEEKQRQNEEIVILESSSLSSETGSWESVFPIKSVPKDKANNDAAVDDINKKILDIKKEHQSGAINPGASSSAQKITYKSKPCFIDAASLIDDDSYIPQMDFKSDFTQTTNSVQPVASQPVPCAKSKTDMSPNDWSEANDNDDSLEQADRDPDSIQKDLSPTIFEMTPITEDSLCGTTFETAATAEHVEKKDTVFSYAGIQTQETYEPTTIVLSETPHNSILTVHLPPKPIELEDSETDTSLHSRETPSYLNKLKKYNESSPIISGGASIEDHLPQISSNVGSPMIRRKVPPNVSSWVVDMSSNISANTVSNTNLKKIEERMYKNVSSESKVQDTVNKSRNSVDSDSSEKSSHKFYIDLSSLPDPLPPKKEDGENSTEKKNIFSMYIDLGEKSSVKEMPARLSSSLNIKKNLEAKSKSQKDINTLSSSCEPPSSAPKTINDSCVFEKYESLCSDPNISISEIITLSNNDSSIQIQDKNESIESTGSTLSKAAEVKESNKSLNKIGDISKMKNNSNRKDKPAKHSNGDKWKTSAVIEEEPTGDLFVKLSDLDKPVQKADNLINEDKAKARMTRSIPENHWAEDPNLAVSRSSELCSSFHSENALSLNRLFPHLQNEFSRSMPGSLSNRTRSPMRPGVMTASPGGTLSDEPGSSVSELSSMQSSICRSAVDNGMTDDNSVLSSYIMNTCHSRLGQDLLRMFLEEIAPDVIVEAGGRRIKAHKCILSSRCQYFAGYLSGGWVESAGDVIIMPPFSYDVVHFALCHIYSGVAKIPDSISIIQLATIADMLGLDGLKEAIMLTLKSKYCHHFHHPCGICTVGVVECLPVSSVYGLDDLYRKCLKWIALHFPLVWTTRAFASLPKELIEKSYQEVASNLTVTLAINNSFGVGLAEVELPNTRWAEPIYRQLRRLNNACANFMAPRLVEVFEFLKDLPGDPPYHALLTLQESITVAIVRAPPDEMCRAYAYLSDAQSESEISLRNSKPDILNGEIEVNLLFTHVLFWLHETEQALVQSAPRVVTTQAYRELSLRLRSRLRELGCLMLGPPPNSFQQQNRPRRSQQPPSSADLEQVRNSFVPYSTYPKTVQMRQDNDNFINLKKALKVNPPKIRTTKAQEERAKYNLSKSNQSQDKLNKISRPSYDNAKPRYLTPRTCQPGQKPAPRMISSSESSRNSSPINARRFNRGKPQNIESAQMMSQDSLATSSRPRTAEPSTESLSESQNSNKYATYTKVKHSKGSIESVKSIKSQTSQPLASTSAAKNNKKTKIPVPLNHTCRSNNTSLTLKNGLTKNPSANAQMSGSDTSKSQASKETTRKPTGDRKISRSLMNATKSSSAKVVPKVVRECNKNNPTNNGKPNKHKSRQEQTQQQRIPVMERSGTFLKDEPTFGDKTYELSSSS